jgi:mono/diheme cytochrome c family protein
MRKGTEIAILSSLSILCSSIIGCGASSTDGAILFQRERCIYCHTFKGKGATIGPDLTDVSKRRSDEWLRDQIRDPKLHYLDPGMPGHKYLSKKEINDLTQYLKS